MIEDLREQGLIKTVPVDRKKIQDARDLALRDIATARSILANNQDWAYTIAYNAVLQAGRVLMFSTRLPPGWSKPACFCGEICRMFSLTKMTASFFYGTRRKRNSSVYDTAGSITESEAKFALREAEDLVGKIFAVIDKS